jgi:hypothetical protein
LDFIATSPEFNKPWPKDAPASDGKYDELVDAATALAELLNDYMTVSSLTANDRYRVALERLNALLGIRIDDEYDDGRDFTPPYEP